MLGKLGDQSALRPEVWSTANDSWSQSRGLQIRRVPAETLLVPDLPHVAAYAFGVR